MRILTTQCIPARLAGQCTATRHVRLRAHQMQIIFQTINSAHLRATHARRSQSNLQLRVTGRLKKKVYAQYPRMCLVIE